MRNRCGVRIIGAVLLLALACKLGLAQIGPRYVIELPGNGAPTAGLAQGRVQLAGKGLALIRFQGLTILNVGADAAAYSEDAVRDWPAADLLLVTPASAGRYGGLAPLKALRWPMPVIAAEQGGQAQKSPPDQLPRYYPMQVWDTLDLRKRNTRLRVTAMPGQPGTMHVAGFMLELGNSRSSYRVYVSCEELVGDEIDGLPERLPGADLALLPAREAPELLALHRKQKPADKPGALTAAGYAFTALKR